MRVLLWTEYFWPSIGGMERFALNLVRALQQRGMQFEVVVNTADAAAAEPPPTPSPLPITRLPVRTALTERNVEAIVAVRAALAKLVHRFQPDVVHQTLLGPGDLFLHAAHRGIPLLVTYHQHVPRPLLAADAAIGRALRAADWVAACSAASRGELLASIPELAPRSSVVPNALPDNDQPATVLPPRAPRLLCLGRLVEEKGFDVALAAFAAARVEVPGVRLVIAGDGPQRAPLAAAARRLGVADAVDFLGWVHPDRTAAAIDSATIVLAPSRRDPSSLVTLEAARRARPVIATRIDGIPEIVADGETGLLVPPDDVPALTRAIVRLLRDPDGCAAMSRKALERVRRLFPWVTHVDAYQALYARVSQYRAGERS